MKKCLNKAGTKPEEGDEDYEERKDAWVSNPNIEKIVN